MESSNCHLFSSLAKLSPLSPAILLISVTILVAANSDRLETGFAWRESAGGSNITKYRTHSNAGTHRRHRASQQHSEKDNSRNGEGYDFLHRRPFGPEMIFDYQSSARKTHRRGIGPNT
jgi:hypothetical protein